LGVEGALRAMTNGVAKGPSYTSPVPPVATPSSRDEQVRGVGLGGQQTVVYSVSLKNLYAGEKIHVLSELGVTNDVASRTSSPGSINWNGEHRYNVGLNGKLILAGTADATHGTMITNAQGTQVSPNNHHGLYVQNGTIVVGNRLDGRDAHINLVAAAHIVGADGAVPHDTYTPHRPNMVNLHGKAQLTVDKGSGGVDVVRVATGSPNHNGYTRRQQTSRPALHSQRVEGPAHVGSAPHPKVVALSMPLGHVKRNEILKTKATVRVKNRAAIPTLAGGQLILTNSPASTDGTSVSHRHGTNIGAQQDNFGLTHEGVARAHREYQHAYLNYVLYSGGPGSFRFPHNGALEVRKGEGAIHVTRYVPHHHPPA